MTLAGFAIPGAIVAEHALHAIRNCRASAIGSLTLAR